MGDFSSKAQTFLSELVKRHANLNPHLIIFGSFRFQCSQAKLLITVY